MVEKNIDAFRTISEVAEDLDLPQHVLRFWETRFPQIKPMKRGGGRRYYRPDDVDLLRAIRQLLYGEGYTIKGVQRILKEQGVRAVVAAVSAGAFPPRSSASRAEPDDGADEEFADDESARKPAAATPMPANFRSAPAAVRAPSPVAPRPPPAERDAPLLAPAATRAPTRAPGVLSEMDLRRLRAALADLAECERILAAARRV